MATSMPGKLAAGHAAALGLAPPGHVQQQGGAALAADDEAALEPGRAAGRRGVGAALEADRVERGGEAVRPGPAAAVQEPGAVAVARRDRDRDRAAWLHDRVGGDHAPAASRSQSGHDEWAG